MGRLLTIMLLACAFAANAATYNWTNTPNATGYEPGDTVNFYGTVTNQFVVTNSGAAGSPITFNLYADFVSPCWPVSGAISVTSRSNLIIDGKGIGKIRNTANGTGLGTNDSRAVSGTFNGDGGILFNSRIQNLTITNMYRKVRLTPDDQRLGYGIVVSGNDIVVSNCVVSDGDGMIFHYMSDMVHSNVTFINNTVLDYNHGIGAGTGDSNSKLVNLVIDGNFFDHSDTWGGSAANVHMDAIYIINNTYDVTSIIDGLYIRNNHFGGNVGNEAGTEGATGAIAIYRYANEQTLNVFVYNNLATGVGSNYWANAWFGGSGSNVWVFNNTGIASRTNNQWWGAAQAVSAGGTNVQAYNNLLVGGGSLLLVSGSSETEPGDQSGGTTEHYLTNFFTSIWSDYNVWTDLNAGWGVRCGHAGGTWNSGNLNTLANWQTWNNNDRGMTEPIWNVLHADPHSKTNAPVFVEGTYVPVADDTIARGAGTNLTTVLAPWLGTIKDRNGNARPAQGNWTIGAYETAGTPESPLPPAQSGSARASKVYVRTIR